jgi:hypothetical protein
MAPKGSRVKKAKVEQGLAAQPGDGSPAAGNAPATVDAKPETHCNFAYYQHVSADVDVILNKWPNIVSFDALPETGTSGTQSLVGYGSPYNPQVFDTRFPEPDFEYSCHINFMWVNALKSILSFVPLYWQRVVELSGSITSPCKLKFELVLLTNFDEGPHLPRGGLLRVSPCEQVHAVLHKVASRITCPGTTPEEMDQWLRVLLSAPAVFKKLVGNDVQFAEANSLRQDIDATAQSVVFTARQIVHNVWGFKDGDLCPLTYPEAVKI